MISMSAPQYNNSGKYTTYMHIRNQSGMISCLSLRFFLFHKGVMEEKKIGGFSSLCLRNFHFHPQCTPWVSVEQANKTSPRFHPGQTSELIITNLRNSYIVLSKQPKDSLQNYLIGQWA